MKEEKEVAPPPPPLASPSPSPSFPFLFLFSFLAKCPERGIEFMFEIGLIPILFPVSVKQGVIGIHSRYLHDYDKKKPSLKIKENPLLISWSPHNRNQSSSLCATALYVLPFVLLLTFCLIDLLFLLSFSFSSLSPAPYLL